MSFKTAASRKAFFAKLYHGQIKSKGFGKYHGYKPMKYKGI
jgi:hypothetical protein